MIFTRQSLVLGCKLCRYIYFDKFGFFSVVHCIKKSPFVLCLSRICVNGKGKSQKSKLVWHMNLYAIMVYPF